MPRSFVCRPFRGEFDLRDTVAMMNAANLADGIDDRTTIEQVRRELVDTEPGWLKTAALWEEAGRIVAFAAIFTPEEQNEAHDTYLWWEIQPEDRIDALGEGVIRWAEAAAKRLAGDTVKLSGGCADSATWKRALMERHGFRPVRYFQRLTRDLTQPISPVAVPDGYTIRPIAGPDEAAAWVACFNNSFIDHWSHIPETVEHRQFVMESPDYLREADLVAVAPDGSFVAFATANRQEHDDGTTQWWIHLLGTDRTHRRRGLARAILSASLEVMRARGAEQVLLGVDADSPTGATRLYETAGFTIAHRSTALVKQLD